MKFSRLSSSELKSLEKEFVEFLAVHGIDSDYWGKLKKKENEKAEDLIDIFSDVVWQKTIDKIEFLEHRTNRSIKLFNCKKDSIELIGIDGNIKDLNKGKLSTLNQNKLSIYTHTKTYSPNRDQELFNMIKGGCSLSDNQLFNKLKKLV